eukprot:12214065-Ditylum_brightwellii.AAC.1
MKVKKDDMKAADFRAVVAAAKKAIESGKHRQDGMDIISIVIDDKESPDEESSGCESSSAPPPSSGLPSSGSPSSSM